MTLWQLILLIAGLGIVLWVLEQAPFISDSVKPLLRWVFLVIIVLALLQAFGFIHALDKIRPGR